MTSIFPIKLNNKSRHEQEAEDAVRTLLKYAGDDPDREGLLETPDRVVRAFAEHFSGYGQDAEKILSTSFSETDGYKEMVTLKNMPFVSHCEHHMAPFTGLAHVAYLPSDVVVGISKLTRVVDVFAKRLQIQERMTKQIADCLQRILAPRGVAVSIEATHSCMTSRGVNKPGVVMVTSQFFGEFKTDHRLRQEFLMMIGGGHG